MRHGFYMRFHKQIPPDIMVSLFSKKFDSEKRKQLKKGFRIMNPHDVQIGENGIDFRMNRLTAIVHYYLYKTPRIVSKLLLRRTGIR